MRFYVGITDSAWFRFHAERKPDEVNFWRPGGDSGFGVLEQGAPFLFKLHSPEDYIVGGGFYYRFCKVQLSLAWRLYGEMNGTDDFLQFRHAILSYRKEPDNPEVDPIIGCIILEAPFFFPRDLWLPQPSDWHPNIVQGKGYDSSSGTGKQLWDRVLRTLEQVPGSLDVAAIRKKGPLYVVEGRVGQAGFRTAVMEAYHRRCAISEERTVPALEASHIKSYKRSGPNKISNGIFLRADLHQIFDEGYITITKDFRIKVSQRIKQEFENGREYYRFNDLILPNLPHVPSERPDARFIEWHNQNVYRG